MAEPTQNLWWDRILDAREAKKQLFFAMPIILTNITYYMIPVISVMFAGHLGELDLAASTLATSWSSVTGLSFMMGLSGALEILCEQCNDAGQYIMMGLYLQSSCVISFLFCILISIFWWCSDAIFILCHQDPEISKAAGLYLKFLIPGLFAYGLFQNMLRFVHAQFVVVPLFACSVVPAILQVGITFVLVEKTDLGFCGAALASSISLCIAAVILGLYICRSSRFYGTWNGFSMESLAYIYTNINMAIPCAAIICLKSWPFQLLVLLAGLMPNPKITISVIAMCIDTQNIFYMISRGLSMVVSTRLANELGAGNPLGAKNAMYVGLKVCVVVGLAVDLTFGFGSHVWARLFSDSPVIISQYGAMTYFLMMSIFIEFLQGIVSDLFHLSFFLGVIRGYDLGRFAFIINTGGFYIIGMIMAGLLSFKLKLYAKGLWIGLTCGMACQVCGMLLLVVFKKGSKLHPYHDTNIEENII